MGDLRKAGKNCHCYFWCHWRSVIFDVLRGSTYMVHVHGGVRLKGLHIKTKNHFL
jgi:hypothetical protein